VKEMPSGVRSSWVQIFWAQAKSQVRSSGMRKGVFGVGFVRVWHGVVLQGESRNVFLYGYKADHGDDGLICCWRMLGLATFECDAADH
jgi:hypothetical protein